MLKVTKRLANFASETVFEDLPKDVVERAKLCLLDWMGAALAGSDERPTRLATNMFREIGGRKESTVVRGEMTSCTNAAFVNGLMSHFLELDDSTLVNGAAFHTGVTTIPPALALGERERCTGKDFIAAVVLGYDIGIRIAAIVNPSHIDKGWHGTGTLGSFCAVASAGKILKLDSSQMINALGIAGTQASGFQQTFGSMCKSFHAGRASYNGVIGALLASKGFTNAPDLLEGKRGFCKVTSDDFNVEQAIRDLGRDYKIMNNKFKIHASCGMTHGAIDALLKIVEKEDLKSVDVKEIRLKVARFVKEIVGQDFQPRDKIQAKFSLPFCAAIAVYRREASLSEFNDEMVSDRMVGKLMRRVVLEADSTMDKVLSNGAFGAQVSIQTKDGRTFQERVDIPRGYRGNPLSKRELVHKFRDLAKPFLRRKDVDRIVHIVDDLENLPDIRSLTKSLGKTEKTSVIVR